MKKRFIRTVALTLSILLILLSVSACSGKNGKALLTLKKDGIKVTFSANAYELLLSRLKGAFVEYGYTNESKQTADQDAFWTLQDTFDGKLMSYDDRYRDLVLDDCRVYLAALWMFESRGLKLKNAQIEEVDEYMQSLLNDYASGSKTKLNALLTDYGVNYNILRDLYLTDEKVDSVKTDLYGQNASKLGSTVKDEYLKENYLHFKQIFLANYEYVYETDANGDVIYYDDAGNILYDKVNGYEGNDGVWYTSQDDRSHVCYDTVNGTRHIANDTNGEPITKKISSDEEEKLELKADRLCEELQGATAEKFEDAIQKYGFESEYSDGYYLIRGADYSSVASDLGSLTAISAALEEMKVGEIRLTPSDSGYHIIMKYEPTPGAYDNEVNEVWFKNFADNLTEKLFREECEKLFGEITLDEKVFATVPPIREIKPNQFF